MSQTEKKKRNSILLHIESEIDGVDSHGPVEFVVKDGDFVVVIVEVKRQDLEQGRAQLLMQMKCAQENQVVLAHNWFYVCLRCFFQGGLAYGFVTTGDIWYPIHRDHTGEFLEAPRLLLDPRDPKEEQVYELLKVLHACITQGALPSSSE